MNIQLQRIRPSATVPTYGSFGAAGADLYAAPEDDNDVVLQPGETVKIGTGIAVLLEPGWALFVYARSSLGVMGLRPANCVGVVDSDYTGEIIVPLHNDSRSPLTVFPGERIAQAVLAPVRQAQFVVVDKLPATRRGGAGFGSTGR